MLSIIYIWHFHRLQFQVKKKKKHGGGGRNPHTKKEKTNMGTQREQNKFTCGIKYYP